jgi:hypothetical protein
VGPLRGGGLLRRENLRLIILAALAVMLGLLVVITEGNPEKRSADDQLLYLSPVPPVSLISPLSPVSPLSPPVP